MESSWQELNRHVQSGIAWRQSSADWLKRAFDIIGAALLLILFAPVLSIAAIAIRLGGSKSIFFTQTRTGRHGKPFQILKLTTMNPKAHLTGPLVSTSKDPRVTCTGRIIRAFCLNELPQLLNVIRGEMSLVGPRPEVPRYIESWPLDVKSRLLSVKPGITGLATIRIWDEATLLEGREDVERAYLEEVLPVKQQIELWYMGHRSIWLDLWILGVTFFKALAGRRLFGPDRNRGVPQATYQRETK